MGSSEDVSVGYQRSPAELPSRIVRERNLPGVLIYLRHDTSNNAVHR